MFSQGDANVVKFFVRLTETQISTLNVRVYDRRSFVWRIEHLFNTIGCYQTHVVRSKIMHDVMCVYQDAGMLTNCQVYRELKCMGETEVLHLCKFHPSRLWSMLREHIRMRRVALVIYEEFQRRACAPQGAGRCRDLELFLADAALTDGFSDA